MNLALLARIRHVTGETAGGEVAADEVLSGDGVTGIGVFYVMKKRSIVLFSFLTTSRFSGYDVA